MDLHKLIRYINKGLDVNRAYTKFDSLTNFRIYDI